MEIPDIYKIEKLEIELADIIFRISQFINKKEKTGLIDAEQQLLNNNIKEYYEKMVELEELKPPRISLTPTETTELTQKTGKLYPEIKDKFENIKITPKTLEKAMKDTNKSKVEVIIMLMDL